MLNSNISHSSVVTVFFCFVLFFWCLILKKSNDGNTLFWVETVELGVTGEDEGRIVCHPPLQVTTESLAEKKISQKAVELSDLVKWEQCGQCYK